MNEPAARRTDQDQHREGPEARRSHRGRTARVRWTRRCVPQAGSSPTSAGSMPSRRSSRAMSSACIVNVTGQPVSKGQPLFEVYSPELVSAQREYAIADAGRGLAEGRRGHGAGRHAAAGRVEPAAPAQLGHLRRADQGAGQLRRGKAHPDLPLAGLRHRDGEKGGAGHALHARRGALPDRRPVFGVGDRRCLRAGHRAGQVRRQGQDQDQCLSRQGVRGQGDLCLSDAQGRDAHRAGAHRTGQPRPAAQAGHVRAGGTVSRRPKARWSPCRCRPSSTAARARSC